MAASENKGVAVSGNEKNGVDPIPNTHVSFGQLLDLGVINQFGQLLGDYSRLDEELWLCDLENDKSMDALDSGYEGLKCQIIPSGCKEPIAQYVCLMTLASILSPNPDNERNFRIVSNLVKENTKIFPGLKRSIIESLFVKRSGKSLWNGVAVVSCQ
uniref:Uncharacterized protein n=1 Tax=Chenopodium quinoa TaxID=63459 RepID=A0A803MU10_CHEQI